MKVSVPTSAERRVKPKDNTSLKVQNYDLDNMYPQRVRNIIASSGTGSACSDLLKKHLRGRGFANEKLETLVVNERGETLGDIHYLICEDRSLFRGFAIHLGYNALFEVVNVTHVPIEQIRLGLPDASGAITYFGIHPDWSRESGRRFDSADIKYVDTYSTDPKVISTQIKNAGGFSKWKGQLLYFSESGHLTYPLSVCDSVLEDVGTDSGIKVWKNRGVLTGFACNHILMYKGEFESEEKRKEFIEDVNLYQGADNSHKIMVVEVPTDESAPELKKIETVNTDKLFELTETTVRDNIIRRYEQPRTLHAIASPGSLGLSKEWEEAKINYDERTEEERKKISSVLAEAFSHWVDGDPGKGAEGFAVVPITGFASKRSKKTLSEMLTADAVKEVRSIVESTSLSESQKIQIILASYPVDEAIANAIVTGTNGNNA